MASSNDENVPTEFRIRVSGCVDQRLANDLGLSVVMLPGAQPSETQLCESVLAGHVIDQAALMGVLNTLYNYGFSILSVDTNESVRNICEDETLLPDRPD